MDGEKPSFLERLIHGPDCLYRQDRIGYWGLHHFARSYLTKTAGGFWMVYTLRGNLKRINNDAFNAARMLEESSIDRLVDNYNQEVVVPHLADTGFFGFGWTGEVPAENIRAQPHVWRYRVIGNGRSRKVQIDRNRSDTVKALNQIPFERDGCEVSLVLMDVAMPEKKLMDENYALLAPQTLEAIEGEYRYRYIDEASAVAGMKKLWDTKAVMFEAMTDQKHDANYVTVQTRRVGSCIEIAWTFNEDNDWNDYNLLGFRKQDGFGPSTYSEEGNGIRVIDSNRNGSAVERLNEGETYYYTLCVTRLQRPGLLEKGGVRYLEAIRFSLRVPTKAEFREVDDRLEKLAGKTAAKWIWLLLQFSLQIQES